MRTLFGILIAGVLCHSAPAGAQPKLVILLRHAEESKHSGVHLSATGFQRALRIPELIAKYLGDLRIGAIYAQGAKRQDSSLRSVQTVVPTADTYNIPIIQDYRKWEGKKAAKEILEDKKLKDKAVVVAWGSDELDDIAERLGLELHGKSDIPEWNKHHYNRAWILEFADNGEVAKFSDVTHGLFPHDPHLSTNKVIALNACETIHQTQK